MITPRKISITVVIAVHNGEETLARVLEHYRENGIDVCLVDNGSTDHTAAIAESYLGDPIKERRFLPFDGVFRLEESLRTKENIVSNSTADWLIHADADEILDSPRVGESLRECIERLDRDGVDLIDCDEFVFVPWSEELNFNGGDFVASMRWYYHFSLPGRTLHRCTRRCKEELTWSRSGGHGLSVVNRKIAPEKLRLRHYVGLSIDHLRAQYFGRVFCGFELERGWHLNRVPMSDDFIRVPDRSRMINLDVDGWCTDRVEQSHFFFHQAHEYRPPVRSHAPDDQPPMPFIVGVEGSGAELLRLMLDAHPDLVVTVDTHWLPAALAHLECSPSDPVGCRQLLEAHPSWSKMGITSECLSRVFDAYDPGKPAEILRAIYNEHAVRSDVKRVGDKTAAHNLKMQKIASFLPEARFIHIIRDGRDVAVSQHDLRFGSGQDVKAAAIMWMWRIREARQQAQFLPHYLEVRYEELILNPESVLRQISSFIELPFRSAQLAYPERANGRPHELCEVEVGGQATMNRKPQSIRAIASPSADVAATGCWETVMKAEEKAQFERVAGNMLTDLGYQRVN